MTAFRTRLAAASSAPLSVLSLSGLLPASS